MDQMCIITGKAGEDYRRILVPIGSDAERLNVIILPWLVVAGKKVNWSDCKRGASNPR